MNRSVSCKYTVKRILRKQPLVAFSQDDQCFLNDMSLRLKSSKQNTDRLCLLAAQVGIDVVYRGDALQKTGYVFAQKPDKASNTRVSTPRYKSKNSGKYRSH